MAISCPIDLDVTRLRDEVRTIFQGTSKERIARKYGVTGVNLLARRRA